VAGAGGVVAAAAGQIVGVHSGKCVDVKGANTADGTPIQLYRCDGTAAQQWKLEADGTPAGARHVHGRAVRQDGERLAPRPEHLPRRREPAWEKLPGGLLCNVHSGRCLGALGWRTADGFRLGIWDCTPHHTNQQWRGPGLGA
jgi:hypothetical protein